MTYYKVTNNKNIFYHIKADSGSMVISMAFDDNSDTYMGLKFSFWDDSIKFITNHIRLIEANTHNIQSVIEDAGFAKREPSKTELMSGSIEVV